MKRYFICFCLLLTLQTPFAQDLHLDAKNGTIPEDIARIIDESWVLFQAEEESEARGALAVNLLPLLRQYYANSRVYFFMLIDSFLGLGFTECLLHASIVLGGAGDTD